MSATLSAFLHHLLAFALVGALVAEFVLLRAELTLQSARTLQRVDMLFGAAAGLLIVVGVLRVIYFEKGLEYYTHSLPFIMKILAFALVGIVSIYPTRLFLSWRKDTKEGRVPQVSEQQMRRARRLVHVELAGVVVILLGAALAARGFVVIH